MPIMLKSVSGRQTAVENNQKNISKTLDTRIYTCYYMFGGEGVTAKEFKRALKKDDKAWYFEQATRHEMAMHPDKPGVVIPITRGTGEIPPGTLNKMLKDAGLK